VCRASFNSGYHYGVKPDETSHRIVSGIYDYLRREFSDAVISSHVDARSGDVVFHVHQGRSGFRLIVTQRFRDGDDGGADAAVRKLSDWNVAETMRRSSGAAIEVRTDGLRRVLI